MGERHATRQGHLQIGKIERPKTLIVTERHEQRIQPAEQRRPVLVEGLDHRGQIAGIGHEGGVGANTQGVHGRREGIDVIDRQRLQNRAALAGDVVGLEEGVALQHVGDQIAVGQHRALGHAGGATGVLQHREVILIQNDGSIRRFGALVEYVI